MAEQRQELVLRSVCRLRGGASAVLALAARPDFDRVRDALCGEHENLDILLPELPGLDAPDVEDAEQSALGEQRYAHERAETHLLDVGADDLGVVHLVENHRTLLGRDAPRKAAADRYADPLAALLAQPEPRRGRKHVAPALLVGVGDLRSRMTRVSPPSVLRTRSRISRRRSSNDSLRSAMSVIVWTRCKRSPNPSASARPRSAIERSVLTRGFRLADVRSHPRSREGCGLRGRTRPRCAGR